jgi:antitoxin ParD1/3/4
MQAGEREAGMNVKVSIEISERYLEFAEGMVRDGAYGSLSEIIEEYLRDMMLSKHDEPTQEQLDSVTAMADVIRRRMASPADQWIEMDENDTMFDDLLRYADEQIKAGR